MDFLFAIAMQLIALLAIEFVMRDNLSFNWSLHCEQTTK